MLKARKILSQTVARALGKVRPNVATSKPRPLDAADQRQAGGGLAEPKLPKRTWY